MPITRPSLGPSFESFRASIAERMPGLAPEMQCILAWAMGAGLLTEQNPAWQIAMDVAPPIDESPIHIRTPWSTVKDQVLSVMRCGGIDHIRQWWGQRGTTVKGISDADRLHDFAQEFSDFFIAKVADARRGVKHPKMKRRLSSSNNA